MHKNDNKFIEEYKKLNRLCGDIFGSNDGVNDYLRAMEKQSSSAHSVAGWQKDYKMLKSLRHIRNQIAHDDTTANVFSTKEDIDKVKDFYKRISTGKDPLALLRKTSVSKKKRLAIPILVVLLVLALAALIAVLLKLF